MSVHRLVEAPGGEPMVGAGAVEVDTGLPVAQFVAWTDAVAPETSQQPGRLQVDADQLDAASLQFRTKKIGDV